MVGLLDQLIQCSGTAHYYCPSLSQMLQDNKRAIQNYTYATTTEPKIAALIIEG